jgi:hypothetical protein
MQSKILGLVATAGLVAAQVSTEYTSTATRNVAAAAATANTRSPTSNVKGKAFDRLAIVWLENTDYDLAAGDRKLTIPPPVLAPHPTRCNPMPRKMTDKLDSKPGVVGYQRNHFVQPLRRHSPQ